MSSSLPGAALGAARNALKAAHVDAAKTVDSPSGADGAESVEEGQELTLEERPDDEMRTVFNDPATFNVKVSCLSVSLY